MTVSRRDVLKYGAAGGIAAIAVGGGAFAADARGRRRRRRWGHRDEGPVRVRGTTTTIEDGPGQDEAASGPSTSTSTDTPSSPSTTECCTTVSGGSWSDPSTWADGAVPPTGDAVRISGPVILDVDVEVRSLTIEEGAILAFAPEASARLTSTGNVVVAGVLTMKPGGPSVNHNIHFAGVDESNYIGGGMSVLDDDVGLWVVEHGTLDIAGSSKLAWTRAAGSLDSGSRTIELTSDPTGWQVGDELVVTPTARPDSDDSHTADVVTVASINGRTIQLADGLEANHPTVDLGPAGTLGAEVLNLTRNVGIEGTEGGRAHIMIVHAHNPQNVHHATLRHLGPMRGDDGVAGRYPLHFHHCREGSNGSLIEGVVARDCGNHAFVPHESGGTTWRNCIAHEIRDHAYWWDPQDEAWDTLYDGCVASNVVPNGEPYTHSGFWFGQGPQGSNSVRGCVATNVEGVGFSWYEGTGWNADDCVAHNNEESGIISWQNNGAIMTVSNFSTYRNDVNGINQGAYSNAFRYFGGSHVENAQSQVVVGAVSSRDDNNNGLTFSDLYLDAAGVEYGFEVDDGSPVDPALPTSFLNCRVVNASQAGIGWQGSGKQAQAVVQGCSFDGREIWLEDEVGSNSRIEFYGSSRGDVMVSGRDGAGTFANDWNAAVSSL